MGAGYAVYVPEEEAEEVVSVAARCGLEAFVAGQVVTGPRQVVIEPLGIVFEGETLGVR
jgi:phosphoribosylformylglycinamidine cyclo-ligase